MPGLNRDLLELVEVVEAVVLRGIEEVDDVPVPANLTAGDNSANPTAGGSYLRTLYTFFCEGGRRIARSAIL